MIAESVQCRRAVVNLLPPKDPVVDEVPFATHDSHSQASAPPAVHHQKADDRKHDECACDRQTDALVDALPIHLSILFS